jgi:hypothetical protein
MPQLALLFTRTMKGIGNSTCRHVYNTCRLVFDAARSQSLITVHLRETSDRVLIWHAKVIFNPEFSDITKYNFLADITEFGIKFHFRMPYTQPYILAIGGIETLSFVNES